MNFDKIDSGFRKLTLACELTSGALQSASEQERMKIMAVLNAIRSPAFQAELGIAPSTGSSSPRDSETGFHTASETGSISSGMTAGSDDHHHDLTMPPPPPPPMHAQTESVPREYSVSTCMNHMILGLNGFQCVLYFIP